ncbi:MAG TPA: tetratricopeptide repeat protein [Anaerolineales bacterium]|nr:tetratricopeptide repeat protein [Anaerolineales bacterium]
MNLFRRKKPTELVDNRVDLDPDDLEPATADEYLKRGLIYLARGGEDEAESDLKRVLSLEPDSVDAHYNLGLMYKSQGKVGEARGAFEAALDKIPILEEENPVRAHMVSRLIQWQLVHVDQAA